MAVGHGRGEEEEEEEEGADGRTYWTDKRGKEEEEDGAIPFIRVRRRDGARKEGKGG